MSVERVVAEAGTLLGRCVTVEAKARGRSLYSGLQGEYLAARHGALDGNPYRLGYYPFDDGVSPETLLPGRYVLTGVVMTCVHLQRLLEARNTDPDFLPQVTGYCHQLSGPVIMPELRQRAPDVREERFVGEEARAHFGDIERAPADWPHLPRMLAAATAFRRAAAAGDRAALARLHLFDEDDPDAQLIYSHIASGAGGFDALRGPREPQLAVFVDLESVRRRAEEEGDRPAAYLCFCRIDGCDGLWPISSLDTGARDDRPYVCTFHEMNPGDGGLEETFVTLEDPFGAPEPAASAVRKR
jgi:hypothetical protein